MRAIEEHATARERVRGQPLLSLCEAQHTLTLGVALKEGLQNSCRREPPMFSNVLSYR